MTTSIVVDPAAEQTQTTQDPADKTAEESKIPEKYRGKSVEDIVGILQNVESELGRKNNEVGTLRRLTDQVLNMGLQVQNSRTDNQQTQTRTKLTTEDLLSDPEKSVSELAQEAADKRVASVDKRTANIEAQLQYDRFQRTYPDFEQTVMSDEFKSWVGSSNYRQRLAYRAAQNDWDAAGELIGLFNENKPKTETTTKTETPDPKAAAKAAGLAKRGGSSAAGVGASSDGKKIYSRAELIELRIKDPEGYEARYTSEFLPAYRENRVR